MSVRGTVIAIIIKALFIFRGIEIVSINLTPVMLLVFTCCRFTSRSYLNLIIIFFIFRIVLDLSYGLIGLLLVKARFIIIE